MAETRDIITDDYKLMQGDCLERMKEIPCGTIDMILCDLPYGITACKWDKVIPFDKMWEQYLRVAKVNAAIVLFSQMPFGADLITSNRKMFKYEWIYEKANSVGFLHAKDMPLRAHENILVFYRKKPTYNPQFTYDGKKYHKESFVNDKRRHGDVYGENIAKWRLNSSPDGRRFPIDILRFSIGANNQFTNANCGFHPTQKPTDLCEYLVKTYTNPNETVLDNCMGSGSTGVACGNTGRKFMGIELEDEYFNTSIKRIADAYANPTSKPTPMEQLELF